ncbi:MAG: helix-turn-helix domain-containing protein [Ekhidna sp.]|uniref:helix-turn-helix domain-containing protein n=1 Tax=Ekhidna sp. TaxID=2608089 RepID=UPI0032EE182F
MDKYKFIVAKIAEHYSIAPELIFGRNQTTEVSRIRHLIAYLLRSVCRLSLNRVGEILGGRDHSTIINSMNEFNETTYPELWADLDHLRSMVINIEIPNNRWIYSRIREVESIEFKYGENQDVFGIYRLSIV